MVNKASNKLNLILEILSFALRKITSPKAIVLLLRDYALLNSEKSFFCRDYYLENNQDVKEKSSDPLLHFLTKGWGEGRNPCPYFDVNYYLKQHLDVKRSGINPLSHYVNTGWREGRNPSPDLDTKEFIAVNPEILTNKIHPLVHYSNLETDQQSNQAQPLNRLGFGKSKYILNRPLVVIIPIFLANQSAIDVFSLLVRSIVESYPTGNDLLRFMFIDDSSPLKRAEKILIDEGCVGREDVVFIENNTNLGFVQTVNKGFMLVSDNSDFVILNSDTEIHGPIFECLQSLCYRYKNIASVTPLSNRATIASLENWPYGSDAIYELKASEIATMVNSIQLLSPYIQAPTGHGFCMYIAGEVMSRVGVFDEKSFGKGYGEENDWSIRAIKQGYKHLISTECYVHHHESKSFGASQRENLQELNSETLIQKHPFYNELIQYYLNSNPLKNYRILLKILLLAQRKKEENLSTICFVLHDSYSNQYGGVQQHIRQMVDYLCTEDNMEVFVFSPTAFRSEDYSIHFFKHSENHILEKLDRGSALNILNTLNNRIDYLHVHNTYGLHCSFIDWITHIEVKKKMITVHDYHLFCHNPFLMNEQNEFCFSKIGTLDCKAKECCRDGKQENDFFRTFDRVFVPSENCASYIKQLAPEIGESKVTILPLFLSFQDKIISNPASCNELNAKSKIKNIVFLGSLYPHKGGELFLSALDSLRKLGYCSYVWGQVQPSWIEKCEDQQLPVISYNNWSGLDELGSQYGAHIAVMPSLCAETFSYTMYEALFILEIPIVVGEFGNPADVVNTFKVGEITVGSDVNGFIQAIEKIDKDYDKYKERVRQFKKKYLNDFGIEIFMTDYYKCFSEKKLYKLQAEDKFVSTNFFEPPSLRTGLDIMNRSAFIQIKNDLKVLVVQGLAAENPPSFYRVENPVHFLKRSGCEVEICTLDNLPKGNGKYDIVYLSRTPWTQDLALFCEKIKLNKIPLVLDVDDLIFHSNFLENFYFLGKHEDKTKEYKNLLSGLEKTFKAVDYLIGSTPRIVYEAEKLGKTAVCCRNVLLQKHLQLYPKLFQSRPKSKRKLIGYFSGSSTHDTDFAYLHSVLEDILRRDKEVELLIMGFIGECRLTEKYSSRIIVKPFESYENYLLNMRECKVIVAPIAEINNFSNSKSNIKFLEAASVGTPIISSPIDEMNKAIIQGNTGWIASTHSEWQRYLQIALSGEFAEYVGECANQNVMQNFNGESSDFHKVLQAITECHHE